MNQKPLRLVERTIRASSDPGDVVWEPFGGMATGAVAMLRTDRRGYAAEINSSFFKLAAERLRTIDPHGHAGETTQAA